MRGADFLRESRVRSIAAIAIAAGAVLAAGCDRQVAPPASAADTLQREEPAAAALPAAANDRAKAPAPAPAAGGPEPISDAAITARVKSEIRRDPALAGADVSVNTSRGVVDLAGSVTSHEQAAEAAAHAQSPDGVVRVDSHLLVNPP